MQQKKNYNVGDNMDKDKMLEAMYVAQKEINDRGYNLVYLGYYGAHNYNLDDKNSDYDFKAIVIPTLEQLIKRETISEVVDYKFGQIDIKDILTFTSNVNKGNFSYIEVLQTKYCIDYGKSLFGVISIKKLFKDAKVNYMSMVGAIAEKRKAFNHEYPSKKEEIAKYGCDPKQFNQAVRLYDLLKLRQSYSGEDFNHSYLTYTDSDEPVIYLKECEGESSSRKYEFTLKEFIKSKRELIMPLDETTNIFDRIQGLARNLIEKDYKFKPMNYNDTIIELLINYYKKELIKEEDEFLSGWN